MFNITNILKVFCIYPCVFPKFVTLQSKGSNTAMDAAPNCFFYVSISFRQSPKAYDTSMALVTFCFGSVFGMVTVRIPSSTLAEIWSFTTSSGSV